KAGLLCFLRLLAMDGALAESDLASSVVNAVIEGCMGETVAASEARVGAASAGDGAVQVALESHAEMPARSLAALGPGAPGATLPASDLQRPRRTEAGASALLI